MNYSAHSEKKKDISNKFPHNFLLYNFSHFKPQEIFFYPWMTVVDLLFLWFHIFVQSTKECVIPFGPWLLIHLHTEVRCNRNRNLGAFQFMLGEEWSKGWPDVSENHLHYCSLCGMTQDYACASESHMLWVLQTTWLNSSGSAKEFPNQLFLL